MVAWNKGIIGYPHKSNIHINLEDVKNDIEQNKFTTKQIIEKYNCSSQIVKYIKRKYEVTYNILKRNNYNNANSLKKGKSSWNKGIKGYRNYYKKISNINWNEVKNDIENNKFSNKQLVKKYNICSTTIYKYICEKFNDTYLILKENNREAKKHIINGQSAKYVYYRKQIRLGLINCEKCNTNIHVQIHHNDNYHYKENGNRHTKDLHDNIIFLCSSCHQKLHYLNGSKKHKVKHSKENGRFLKNEVQNG